MININYRKKKNIMKKNNNNSNQFINIYRNSSRIKKVDIIIILKVIHILINQFEEVQSLISL